MANKSYILEINDFHTKKKSVNFFTIDQSAYKHWFLIFFFFFETCRRQYFTYCENFQKTKPKMILKIISLKLATLVDGDPKAPFSIATTPRCREGSYSIPWISPLYPWSTPYNAVKQGSIKYHFWVFGMTLAGIEPRSPGSLLNTLLIRPPLDC